MMMMTPPVSLMSTIIKPLIQQVAVCATIHTPTAYCFKQFDRIMLMARGRMIYSGPNSPVALGFFHGLGYKQREGACIRGPTHCRTHEVHTLMRTRHVATLVPIGVLFCAMAVLDQPRLGCHPSSQPHGAVVFSYLQGSYQRPAGDSPAEALLDIVTTVQDEQAIDKACRQFATSAVAQEDAATLEHLAVPHAEKGSLSQLIAGSRGSKATVTPFWFAAMVFFRYRTWRNYTYIGFLGPRILPTLLFSVLLSVLYEARVHLSCITAAASLEGVMYMML